MDIVGLVPEVKKVSAVRIIEFPVRDVAFDPFVGVALVLDVIIPVCGDGGVIMIVYVAVVEPVKGYAQ